MPSERINRHINRKQKLENLDNVRKESDPLIVFKAIDEICDSPHRKNDILAEFEEHLQREMEIFSTPITVSVEDVEVLLTDIRSRWDTNQMNLLIGDCRNSVLRSIVGPFGLGSVVATMDKNGGNVTTVHNARGQVFANNDDKYRFNQEFDRKNYEKDFPKMRKELFQTEDVVIDGYTGQDLIKDGSTHLDHIISAHEIHNDDLARLVASSERRKEIATNPDNITATNSSLNQSKNDNDLIAWMHKTRADGKTNIEYFGINENTARELYNQAKGTYRHAIVKDTVKKIGGDLAKTGTKEAGKMGLQQSLGILLAEFFSAIFDEIADSYRNGFLDSLNNQEFFDALKIRLGRIADRVIARFKDAWAAFKEGTISGFLSNLITMLINMLVTTGQKIVRVIREGFMSIMKALKMVLFPPEGMTRDEAADAALKLIVAGITVTIGILSEDVIEKSITAFFAANIPLLAPFAGMIASVFVGAMTGIVSAILVYGVDRLDVFGVNRKREHAFVIQELDNLIAESEQYNTGRAFQ
ncbi:MAG: hypothetical protein WC405_09035 [Syntrophales bacterium]